MLGSCQCACREIKICTGWGSAGASMLAAATGASLDAQVQSVGRGRHSRTITRHLVACLIACTTLLALGRQRLHLCPCCQCSMLAAQNLAEAWGTRRPAPHQWTGLCLTWSVLRCTRRGCLSCTVLYTSRASINLAGMLTALQHQGLASRAAHYLLGTHSLLPCNEVTTVWCRLPSRLPHGGRGPALTLHAEGAWHRLLAS